MVPAGVKGELKQPPGKAALFLELLSYLGVDLFKDTRNRDNDGGPYGPQVFSQVLNGTSVGN